MEPTIGVLYVHATRVAGPLLERFDGVDERLAVHGGSPAPDAEGLGVDCVLLDAPEGTHVPRGVETARAAYGDVPVVVRTRPGADAPTGDADALVEVAADGPLAGLVDAVVEAAADRLVPDEVVLRDEVLDSVPVGVTIGDASRPDIPVIYANERFERLTGWDRADTLGRNCRFLQGEDTDEDTVAAMAAAIDAGEPVSVEVRNYRPDGTEFWNQVELIPVTDDEGELTHYLGFQRDVTAEKRRERSERRVAGHRSALVDLLGEPVADRATVERALETARGALEVPTAYASVVDETTGEYRVVVQVGEPVREPGDGLELERTYCRETLDEGAVWGFADAAEADQTDHPAFEDTGLSCYLGAPVHVDGARFGTVCFVGPSRRSAAFTEAEHTLASLAASVVGRAIERGATPGEDRSDRETGRAGAETGQ